MITIKKLCIRRVLANISIANKLQLLPRTTTFNNPLYQLQQTPFALTNFGQRLYSAKIIESDDESFFEDFNAEVFQESEKSQLKSIHQQQQVQSKPKKTNEEVIAEYEKKLAEDKNLELKQEDLNEYLIALCKMRNGLLDLEAMQKLLDKLPDKLHHLGVLSFLKDRRLQKQTGEHPLEVTQYIESVGIKQLKTEFNKASKQDKVKLALYALKTLPINLKEEKWLNDFYIDKILKNKDPLISTELFSSSFEHFNLKCKPKQKYDLLMMFMKDHEFYFQNYICFMFVARGFQRRFSDMQNEEERMLAGQIALEYLHKKILAGGITEEDKFVAQYVIPIMEVFSDKPDEIILRFLLDNYYIILSKEYQTHMIFTYFMDYLYQGTNQQIINEIKDKMEKYIETSLYRFNKYKIERQKKLSINPEDKEVLKVIDIITNIQLMLNLRKHRDQPKVYKEIQIQLLESLKEYLEVTEKSVYVKLVHFVNTINFFNEDVLDILSQKLLQYTQSGEMFTPKQINQLAKYFRNFTSSQKGLTLYKMIGDQLNENMKEFTLDDIADNFANLLSALSKSPMYQSKLYNPKIEKLLNQGSKIFEQWNIEEQIYILRNLNILRIHKASEKLQNFCSQQLLEQREEYLKKPYILKSYMEGIQYRKKFKQNLMGPFLDVIDVYFDSMIEHEEYGLTVKQVLYTIEDNLQSDFHEEREKFEKIVAKHKDFIKRDQMKELKDMEDDEDLRKELKGKVGKTL